jgi:hypothetical protein
MKMTRKAVLLGVGLWATGASVALASGRSRTETRAAAGDASEVAREVAAEPQARATVVEIRPGVLQVTTPAGDTYEMNADGSVRMSEIQSRYGSVERMRLERAKSGMAKMTLPNGTVMYADGTVAFFEDMVGPALVKNAEKLAAQAEPKPVSFATLKQSKPWVEVEIGSGYSRVIFLDGTVTAEQFTPVPAWVGHRQRVARYSVGGRSLYADGAVFMDEPSGD